MKKHKIILIELIKPLTSNLTVKERELLSRQIVKKSGLQIKTEPICKTKQLRRIIQTKIIKNKSILKCMVNNLKQANFNKCKKSKAFVLVLIDTFEANDIKKPVQKVLDYLLEKIAKFTIIDKKEIFKKIYGGI